MFTKKLLEMWFKVTKASSPISAVIDLTFMAAAAKQHFITECINHILKAFSPPEIKFAFALKPLYRECLQ